VAPSRSLKVTVASAIARSFDRGTKGKDATVGLVYLTVTEDGGVHRAASESGQCRQGGFGGCERRSGVIVVRSENDARKRTIIGRSEHAAAEQKLRWLQLAGGAT
jgi:hypothetical protein